MIVLNIPAVAFDPRNVKVDWWKSGLSRFGRLSRITPVASDEDNEPFFNKWNRSPGRTSEKGKTGFGNCEKTISETRSIPSF